MVFSVPEELALLLGALEQQVSVGEFTQDSYAQATALDVQVRQWFDRHRQEPQVGEWAAEAFERYQALKGRLEMQHVERAEQVRKRLRSARALWTGGYRMPLR